jgi:hypothetical protein
MDLGKSHGRKDSRYSGNLRLDVLCFRLVATMLPEILWIGNLSCRQTAGSETIARSSQFGIAVEKQQIAPISKFSPPIRYSSDL